MRARDLSVAYGRERVVRDATFTCLPGSITAVVGPNGSGKSTLLHAVAGLVTPVAGTLEVLGGAPGAQPARVAYTLQATKVDERLPVTVREVVAMARYAWLGARHRVRPADRAAVDAALARMEVASLARRRLDELSGGQRQRVFVAQGLAQEADVVLFDEPVTGVDLVSRGLILDALQAERAAGRTVLVATHSLAEAAGYDQIVLLAGRMVAAGPPHAVLTSAFLQEAYGSRVLAVAEGLVLLDDPHHHAEGHDHTDHRH